jgi:hypothetical protein
MLFEVLSDNLTLKHGRTKSSNKVAPRELSVLDIVLQIEGYFIKKVLRFGGLMT